MAKNFTLKVGCHKVRVKFLGREAIQKVYDKSFNDGRHAFGLYMSGRNEILVNNELAPSNQIATFTHELAECMEDKYSLGMKTHEQVTVFGEVLAQILVDNKKFFKELLD